MSCLGEMAALMPVNAPAMEFPRRFLDRGVGFAVGWVYWFAYAVLSADQLVAVTNAVRFHYEDDHGTYMKWVVGNNVHPAVWVSLFLVLVTVANMLPVIVRATPKPRSPRIFADMLAFQYYGELEYIFGSLKLTFIVVLIVMMLILNTMERKSPFVIVSSRPNADQNTIAARANAYYQEPLGSKCI
jgi:amino acid transporter